MELRDTTSYHSPLEVLLVGPSIMIALCTVGTGHKRTPATAAVSVCMCSYRQPQPSPYVLLSPREKTSPVFCELRFRLQCSFCSAPAPCVGIKNKRTPATAAVSPCAPIAKREDLARYCARYGELLGFGYKAAFAPVRSGFLLELDAASRCHELFVCVCVLARGLLLQ